jgi:23S rRNA (cytidine2498-2'-O)-methyltransferase
VRGWICRKHVDTDNVFLVTAQPEFLGEAVAELQRLDTQLSSVEEIAPGIMLCTIPGAAKFMQRAAARNLIFVRHLAPVQVIIPLSNTARDMGKIATAIAQLPSFSLLERGIHFSVQSRFVQTEKSQEHRPFSTGQLNRSLAEAFAEESGSIESINKPQVIISILCTMTTAYLGISPADTNLSSWPGGARHYAHTNEQISRAEFKLLEALEVFSVSLPSEGRALDLGSAPGGWTHLLLEAGLQVVSVDPAQLDSRLMGYSRLKHYRGYAENYLNEAIKKRAMFDIIVNDMRMDARDAARLLVDAAACLTSNGFVISVLKLPHTTPDFDAVAVLKNALHILQERYAIVQARQLFHNRQEVTVFAAHAQRKRS